MLRNKLSAQKSRDKRKEEFEQISKENEELKRMISEKNEIIEQQNKIIASCDDAVEREMKSLRQIYSQVNLSSQVH